MFYVSVGRVMATGLRSNHRLLCSQVADAEAVSGQKDLFVDCRHQPVVKYQCFESARMFGVLLLGLHFSADCPDQRADWLVCDGEVQWKLWAILCRTRFLPLRDLQAENLPWSIPPSWLHLSFLPTHHLLSRCILVVLFAILFYILRLRKIHRREQWQAKALNLLWAKEGEMLRL